MLLHAGLARRTIVLQSVAERAQAPACLSASQAHTARTALTPHLRRRGTAEAPAPLASSPATSLCQVRQAASIALMAKTHRGPAPPLPGNSLPSAHADTQTHRHTHARAHTQVEEYEEDASSLSQSAHESGATLYETRILPRYDTLTRALLGPY